MSKIILASASPRRRELLSQIGIPFYVCKSTCEEKISSTVPGKVVCELSGQKAKDVWQRLVHEGELVPGVTDLSGEENVLSGERAQELLVIGADTIVAYEGQILGKPKDEADACRMLRMLSGHTHEVFTGVTFCYRLHGEERVHTFYERTEVTLYPISEDEIEDYVKSGVPMDKMSNSYQLEWTDKAGGYAIQGIFAKYIKGIKGDYYNVVGLPVSRVYQELKECLQDEKSSYF